MWGFSTGCPEQTQTVSTNRHSLSPCRSNISRTVSNFQLGGAFADQEALTIESSLVSRCIAKNFEVKIEESEKASS